AARRVRAGHRPCRVRARAPADRVRGVGCGDGRSALSGGRSRPRPRPDLGHRRGRRTSAHLAATLKGGRGGMAEVVAGCRRVFTVSAVTHTWVPFDWESLEDEPPVTASLCGLLYPGHTHLFSGEPDSGKSWLAAWICAELVASGDTVIWVDLEQSPRLLHERLRALGLEAEEIAERFVLLSPQEPLAEDIARAVDALVATRRPRLVVVDSMIGLVSLHGYSSNDGGDIEALYRDVLSRFRA